MRRLFCLILSVLFFLRCFGQDTNLLNKAQQGDVNAQNSLAIFYAQNGNESKAVLWWEKAACQNHLSAQSNLGEFYFRKSEYEKALKWIIPAATKGSPEACLRLAQSYLNGYGISVDIQSALDWSEKAAKAGLKNAYTLTYIIYNDYLSNKEMASIWLGRAVDVGEPEALTIMNSLGLEEMAKGNVDKGLKYFMRAADNGFSEAQYNVGIYYINAGQPAIAKIWIAKAAKQNFPKAIQLLQNRELFP